MSRLETWDGILRQLTRMADALERAYPPPRPRPKPTPPLPPMGIPSDPTVTPWSRMHL